MAASLQLRIDDLHSFEHTAGRSEHVYSDHGEGLPDARNFVETLQLDGLDQSDLSRCRTPSRKVERLLPAIYTTPLVSPYTGSTTK